MQTLISVIMPVFILIGFGYLAAWRGYFSPTNVDGLMRFATNFAVPVLLFRAISNLDLAAEYNMSMMGSFYGAAFLCFGTGLIWRQVSVWTRLGGRHRYWFCLPVLKLVASGLGNYGEGLWHR